MTPGTESDPSNTQPKPLLSDGTIQLRLIRTVGQDNALRRSEAERFLDNILEYRFAIHLVEDGLRVGRIHLRRTNDPRITEIIGHSGYAVDEAYRGNGYATRAVRLIIGLAMYWGITPVWILIEPDNIASCKTVKRVGFELIDEIDSTQELFSLGIGAIVRRYRYLST
ncbi:MAG: GNAT family N-acetyltransferase [Planctomycetota bacterium]